jgi:hypothetical protein
MNRVNFQLSNQPTCLILDEIDGAFGGEQTDKGLKMVADYLQKCIKAAPKIKKD